MFFLCIYELSKNKTMDRTPGIEPGTLAWKASILPAILRSVRKARQFFYYLLAYFLPFFVFEVSKKLLLGLKTTLSVSLVIFSTFCFFTLQLLHSFVSFSNFLQLSDLAYA